MSTGDIQDSTIDSDLRGAIAVMGTVPDAGVRIGTWSLNSSSLRRATAKSKSLSLILRRLFHTVDVFAIRDYGRTLQWPSFAGKGFSSYVNKGLWAHDHLISRRNKLHPASSDRPSTFWNTAPAFIVDGVVLGFRTEISGLDITMINAERAASPTLLRPNGKLEHFLRIAASYERDRPQLWIGNLEAPQPARNGIIAALQRAGFATPSNQASTARRSTQRSDELMLFALCQHSEEWAWSEVKTCELFKELLEIPTVVSVLSKDERTLLRELNQEYGPITWVDLIEQGTKVPAPHVPQELTASCINQECVLFAGAGLSARAGLPTWDSFLIQMLEFARAHALIDNNYFKSLNAALSEGERGAVADSLVQAYGNSPSLLNSFLNGLFEPSNSIVSRDLPYAYEELSQIPFSAIVTTNFDRFLERAFEHRELPVYTPTDAEMLLDSHSQKRQFLLKLYGTLERTETVLIAPIEYRSTVAHNLLFSKFMEGLFVSRNFLFVGVSLEGIQDFLGGFPFRSTGSNPREHFALVAVTGSGWKARAELLQRRYNVRVIPFQSSPTFPEVDFFAKQLADSVRTVAPSIHAHRETGVAEAKGLRKLILEDIGAFPYLELEFPKAQKWKVLLGDNGVGKSTVLKAIAAAFVGSDSKEWAGRLVRAGKSMGKITLITESNPSGYVTQIFRKDMETEAEVNSIPSRPLESEGFLTLGFSPLRSVSWNPSPGPQSVAKGRPLAEDVIALLKGDIDSRMDRLKQWIVNLDHADKTLVAVSTSTHQYRAGDIVHMFFRLMGDLIDRPDIEFGGLNSSFRVMLKIKGADERIPMEALSQGLIIRMGWRPRATTLRDS